MVGVGLGKRGASMKFVWGRRGGFGKRCWLGGHCGGEVVRRCERCWGMRGERPRGWWGRSARKKGVCAWAEKSGEVLWRKVVVRERVDGRREVVVAV